MYSPRIREDLVPRIYQAAKAGGVAMTTWVNRAVEAALAATKGGERAGEHINLKAESTHSSARGG